METVNLNSAAMMISSRDEMPSGPGNVLFIFTFRWVFVLNYFKECKIIVFRVWMVYLSVIAASMQLCSVNLT